MTTRVATGPTWAVFAGGGTAGHLLPGLAVARALVAGGRDAAGIHFVGSDRGVEAQLVPEAGFSFEELPGRGVERRLSLGSLRALWLLLRASARGVAIVRRHRPAVVVALGGHASLACGLGAVACRVPLVLLEQNVRAGAVNRLLGRFAAASAVSFAGTDLPRAVVTGNPLRPEIRSVAESPDPVAARTELGLPADRTVVAVVTGSLGSRRINEAVRGLAERWAERTDVAVRHVIGRRDHASFRPPALPEGGLVYQVVEYEERMHLLLVAADIAVSRAGGAVAELAAVGLPAVLVPLPIATRDHQTANAEVLLAAGAAALVDDAELDTDRLAKELDALLGDADTRRRMAAAMRSLARPDAAERVAELVEERARPAQIGRR
jgi:undecaprenyldiphospho-muramoylpentapeptide beta-N-acetylglucosaminyltransferase